jgi:D-alanyl-lipoteichoic acid acyltransferase DltB (MBOAT superfamily)
MDKFVSLEFAAFFSVIFLVHYNLSVKYQWGWILLASIFFYCQYNVLTLITPLLIILVTYYSGYFIEKTVSPKKRVAIFIFGIVFNISVLVFFKYADFFISTGMQFFSWFGVRTVEGYNFFGSIVIPLGISYITFQSIGYLVEIKRETFAAEKSIGRLAGWLLFFPKMIAGPVERAQHFLPQIKKQIHFDYNLIASGARQFGWGLFKKMVIADRLGMYVNSIYGDIYSNSGVPLLIAALFFPVQLYADFSGYTDMALGLARMLGYDLSPNFNQPFSAKSMVEFWRRWHISLSTWFNDYFYTPLVIQKRDWGKWSIVYACMLTFLILGLWHGPNWTYVIFGGIQGCFIAVELFTVKERKNIRRNIPGQLNTALGIIYVFLVFAFSSIFFRSESVSDALYFISHLFQHMGSLKLSVLAHGINSNDYAILFLAIPFMLLVERKALLDTIPQYPLWKRWVVYYLFLSVIVVYGISSGQGFIYKQF